VCLCVSVYVCVRARALKSNFLKIRLARDVLERNYPVTGL
jgi:hypothetical protein